MHILLIAKVRADDAEEALSQAKMLLEGSIDPDENTTGWDYAGDCTVITKDKLQSDWNCKTFKELEENYSDRKATIKEQRDSLRSRLAESLVPRHMPLTEAPLHLNPRNNCGNECLDRKAAVEKLLKSKKGGKLPQSYEELEKAFLDLLEGMVSNDGLNMAFYSLKKMEQVYECIHEPTNRYRTLQCTENHFADLTEETEGKKTFYVATDRHM